MFLVSINLFYTSFLGGDIASIEGHMLLPVINVIVALSPFSAILYVLYKTCAPLDVDAAKV